MIITYIALYPSFRYKEKVSIKSFNKDPNFVNLWSEINLSSMGSRVDHRFLNSQKTKSKVNQDCFSKWELVPAWVPQGTKLGS